MAKSTDSGFRYIWASFGLKHILVNRYWVGYLNFPALHFIILKMEGIKIPIALGYCTHQCLVGGKCSVVAVILHQNITEIHKALCFPQTEAVKQPLKCFCKFPEIVHFHAPDSDRGHLSYTPYK